MVALEVQQNRKYRTGQRLHCSDLLYFVWRWCSIHFLFYKRENDIWDILFRDEAYHQWIMYIICWRKQGCPFLRLSVSCYYICWFYVLRSFTPLYKVNQFFRKKGNQKNKKILMVIKNGIKRQKDRKIPVFFGRVRIVKCCG